MVHLSKFTLPSPLSKRALQLCEVGATKALSRSILPVLIFFMEQRINLYNKNDRQNLKAAHSLKKL